MESPTNNINGLRAIRLSRYKGQDQVDKTKKAKKMNIPALILCILLPIAFFLGYYCAKNTGLDIPFLNP